MSTTALPARRPPLGRLVVYTLLLFAGWNHNLLGIPDRVFWSRAEPRTGYLGSDSHLVVRRLAHPELPAFYPLAGAAPDGGVVPYSSQVGLTGLGLAAVRDLTGASAASVAVAGGAAFAFLTALVVAAVLVTAQRWLGPPTGDVACVLAASTPVFLAFAPSLYWVPWLMLAPFAVVWCFFPRANTPARRALLFGAVGAAVLARALCGYEYITTVVLAPVAAAWFHQTRAGDSLPRRIGVAAGLVAVGLLGFAAAMALHAGQQAAVLGEDGIAVIRARAVGRTLGDPQAEVAVAGAAVVSTTSRLRFAVENFLAYFDQRAVSVAGGFGRVRVDVPLKWVVGAVLAFAAATALTRRRLPREATPLAGAGLLGLGAGVSWQVLAVNHMCVHRHLNLIVFAVPFLPLAYVTAGYALRLVIGEYFAGKFGAAVLAATAVVMGVNGVTDARRRTAEEAEQRAAEVAVAARLGGAIPTVGAELGGNVDTVRPARAVPAEVLLDYGLLDLTTAEPTDPGAVVLTGWALGDCRVTARPTTRVVVACGGSVIPCPVLRFRRPDIESMIGRPVPGTGFVAVVPSAAAARGAPVRVFVVSSAGPERMAEIVVQP